MNEVNRSDRFVVNPTSHDCDCFCKRTDDVISRSDYCCRHRTLIDICWIWADFSSSPCVQTGSGAHPASYLMGTGGSFPGGKAWPGRDADHSPPSSAEVKNE
jgi:hypothetical protein